MLNYRTTFQNQKVHTIFIIMIERCHKRCVIPCRRALILQSTRIIVDPRELGCLLVEHIEGVHLQKEKFEDFLIKARYEMIFPNEICAVVGGRKFDACVEKDFHSCLSNIVARGMVDVCSINKNINFCREDYICQMLPYQLQGVESGEELSKS